MTTNRLASRGAHFGDSSLNITYRNVRDFSFFVTLCLTATFKTLILAVVGVPAALAATWAVEVPYIGRKGTLAISSGKLSIPTFQVHYSTTPRGR